MGSTSDGERPWQSYHTVYTNAKAGMDGVDKEKVQRIVYEMSKGSKYFESEQRKEALMKQKIENLRALCAKLTNKDIAHYQMIANERILELETSRDLSKMWLHCDMDAFYAAVETLENPSLKGKPLAVGSMSMICTANYEARKFGVRAAMPGFIACKLCPDLIFVPTNFKKYTYYSELMRKVFQKYDQDFIAASLDEAYLNITDACKERGVNGDEIPHVNTSAIMRAVKQPCQLICFLFAKIASELRSAIYKETGLTCSTGVAPNRLLAKVCSDINKPNGQFILPNDRKAVITFISTLPIRKVGGIGKVTEHILRDVLGINTCEEMLQKGAFLCAIFSHCATDFFLSIGLGLGRTDTPEHKLRKSISTERTFSAIEDEKLLFQKLADIAETLSSDMEKECLSGRTLTLKLKTASFEVRTRAVSLQKYIQSKEDILSHASKLLKAELPLSLRLMGLRMSHFLEDNHGHPAPMQKTLTSYVISRDSSPNVTCANDSICSDTSDQHLMRNGDIDLPSDDGHCFSTDGLSNFSPYESDGLMESNRVGLAQSHSSSCDEVETKNIYDECFIKSEVNIPKGTDEKTDSLDDKQEAWSGEKVPPIWLDGYICSLCGVELPPNFIEERQEHSDYHLAEMIQKEESLYNTLHAASSQGSQQRFARKSLQVKGTLKKQKSSSKEKYIPIDAFFIKSMKKL